MYNHPAFSDIRGGAPVHAAAGDRLNDRLRRGFKLNNINRIPDSPAQ